MYIQRIDNKKASVFFLVDPKLCLLGLSDRHLYSLSQDKKYPSTPGEYLYGLYEKEKLIAVVTFEEWNSDILNMHFYLSTHNHNKDVIKRFYSIIEDMLINNFKHTKVMVRVPTSCKHVQNVVKAIGFKFEKTIKDGINWRGTVENLEILKTNINREKNNGR